MAVDEWQTSVMVKVWGSKNLWQVLAEDGAATTPLDFFIMLSSAASILGNADQSNYAAENAFQDAYARQLASQGHPAVSINVPVLSDVGFVSERPELMHHLRSAGWSCMSFRELMAALEYYCFQYGRHLSPPSLVPQERILRAQVAPRLWLPPSSAASGHILSGWNKDPYLQPLKLWQYSEAHQNRQRDDARLNSAAQVSSTKDRLAASATLMEAQGLVLETFLSKLSRILSMAEVELSPAKPLHAYGVDSLVAVELRSWFAKEVGADLTVLGMTSQRSIRHVADLAAAKFTSQFFNGVAALDSK